MTAGRPLQRLLLAEVVDYAGLFPPARLTMPEAVVNFAAYRTGPRAWMLGRFVCPASRLTELSDSVSGLRSPPRTPWRISAVAGDDVEADVGRIAEFNREHVSGLRVDAIELRLAEPGGVEAVVRPARGHLEVFVEFPLSADPSSFASALARGGVKAKARTGGIVPEAFPSSAQLAHFLHACARANLPFKATAGLHHPLRREHRLTYEADAPRAEMHGFLNVLLAAALARAGVGEGELEEILEERDMGAFRFDGALGWRSRLLAEDDVRAAREFMIAFGSCSFTEPVDDLAALRLL